MTSPWQKNGIASAKITSSWGTIRIVLAKMMSLQRRHHKVKVKMTGYWHKIGKVKIARWNRKWKSTSPKITMFLRKWRATCAKLQVLHANDELLTWTSQGLLRITNYWRKLAMSQQNSRVPIATFKGPTQKWWAFSTKIQSWIWKWRANVTKITLSERK